MTPSYVRRVENAARHLVTALGSAPETAVVLGSGLGEVADIVAVDSRLSYVDIPGATKPGVPSHRGAVTSGLIDGLSVWFLEGRVHLYEGLDVHEVVFMTRVLACCGVKRVILTNACGGMRPHFRVGDTMVITDHINLMGVSPLEGPNHSEWGDRFPDMSAAYNPETVRFLRESAASSGLTLHEGVYAGVKGPNLETAAEYRMIRGMGADTVGMSTVPEAIAAVHMGMSVTGLSVITDLCNPDDLKPVSLDQILAGATAAIPCIQTLLVALLRRESR